MNMHKKLLTAASLLAALGLAGCWDDDDEDEPRRPTAAAEVPDSAGVSTASFIGFLLGLAADDESSEPATFKDTFAVPADETDEPTPLT